MKWLILPLFTVLDGYETITYVLESVFMAKKMDFGFIDSVKVTQADGAPFWASKVQVWWVA